MNMKRKPNQYKPTRPKGGHNSRYDAHAPAFTYLLSPDAGGKGKSDFELTYIPDEATNRALMGIVEYPMDGICVLIGNPGQGKTSDIKYTFGCGNNAPQLWKEKQTVIFPVFCHGIILETSAGGGLAVAHARMGMEKSVSAVCTMMEGEIAGLRDWFDSPEGQRDFCQFIRDTNPKALEDPKATPQDEGNRSDAEKIRIAKENDFFIYVVSKLKFYLASGRTDYNRVLVIIDNIEAQSQAYRDQLVLLYMKLYNCLHNYPYSGAGERAYVNLLIAIDPASYRELERHPGMIGLQSARKIYKEGGLDIQKYFRKKAAAIPKELKRNNYRMWREAEDTLDAFCGRLDGKYASMIMGLADNSVQTALKLFDRILSNPYWITKDSCTDGNVAEGGYVYNNITVIRAVACGPNLVYRGEDSPIPNVLLNSELDDDNNSILSLYIIAYFKPETSEYQGYGANTVEESRLRGDLFDLFTDNSLTDIQRMNKRITKTLGNLCASGVIGEALGAGSENPKLFITRKGSEIWNMLARDSVLLEMYREDYYQDYDPEKHDAGADRFKSSQDFMQDGRQQSIFVELYKLLCELFQIERNMLEVVIRNGAGNKYGCLFGAETMVGHLMEGVHRSVEFSGKTGVPDVLYQREHLEREINEVRLQL